MLNNGQPPTEIEVLPLWSAVFCLDCEVISNSNRDECPSCKGHSIASLSRMLGGSLIGQRAHSFGPVLFDVTITVGMRQMRVEDLNKALDLLSGWISQELERVPASVHIDVAPVGRAIAAEKALETSNHGCAPST